MDDWLSWFSAVLHVQHDDAFRWLTILASITAALIGAFLGAILKWIFDVRIARQRNAFDLHKELHSTQIIEARTRGWEILKINPKLTFMEIRTSEDHTDRVKNLWVIMQFFHRVSSARTRKFISQSLTFELFGELLVWWYIVAFKDKLCGNGW